MVLGQKVWNDLRKRKISSADVGVQMMPGPGYGFQTYQKTPLMLSMLGGIVGD